MTTSSAGLACRLIGHRDPSVGQWNDGHCFGRCPRCGCDLVRTDGSAWQPPRGFRVVWKAAPKEAPATPLFSWDQSPEPLEWELAHSPLEAPTPLRAAATENSDTEAEAPPQPTDAPATPEWPLTHFGSSPEKSEHPDDAGETIEHAQRPVVAPAFFAQAPAAPGPEEPPEPILQPPVAEDFMNDDPDSGGWDFPERDVSDLFPPR